jgi:hypothetical protein
VPLAKLRKQGGEAFHFIAYLPVGGTLYELDGLQAGPIRLAEGIVGGITEVLARLKLRRAVEMAWRFWWEWVARLFARA